MVRWTRVHGCVHRSPVRHSPLDRVQNRPSQRRRSYRATSAFTRLAGASCILFALTSARAENVSCPSETAAFEANGAALAFPKVRVGLPLDILAIGSASPEGTGAAFPADG